MRFAPTEDQVLFQEAVRDLLAKECPPEVVRASIDDTSAWRQAWDRLAEMGVLGVLAPEDAGGLGMTEIELVLVLEETGKSALPGPIVEHAMVTVPALVEAGRTDLAGQLASGEVMATAAYNGRVNWSDVAQYVVTVDKSVSLATDVATTPLDGVDPTGRPARTETSATAGDRLDGADAALAFDRAALGAAAQLVGLGATMIDLAVGYAKERKQFGVPIGSYQAIKHHLADALLAVEYARPAVLRAAWSIAQRTPERSRDVSMAKALAARAADLAGRKALQCHGAIGYSYEYDLHLWMKRSWALQAAWGDTAFHRVRVARAVVDPA